jgi:hypothetical protein
LTETQYITLLIGLAITVGANMAASLTALLINNSRLGAVKEALRAEMAQSRAETRANIAEVKAAEAIHHSELLQKFADLDARLSHIER